MSTSDPSRPEGAQHAAQPQAAPTMSGTQQLLDAQLAAFNQLVQNQLLALRGAGVRRQATSPAAAPTPATPPQGEPSQAPPSTSAEAPADGDKSLAFFTRREGKPGLKGSTVGDEKPHHPVPDITLEARPEVKFGFYFFGNYPAGFRDDKYDLLFAAARFADTHGFEGLWFPERHFHPFGGLSPNASVLAAALARETKRVRLCAGSVVLPLHHPVRVAEEWSLVDNLSKGRVGLSVASGWHPNDFVLAPHNFGQHKDMTFEHVDLIRRLWRGEPVTFPDGVGNQFPVQLFPRPLQKEPTIWMTVVNNPETYRRAGEVGAGILTNLMSQTPEALADNLKIHRQALIDHGHDPEAAPVTVLLHTFLGNDQQAVMEHARKPFHAYLESSVGLFKNMAAAHGLSVDFDRLSEEDNEYLMDLAYQRYAATSALVGTPDSCMPIVEQLRQMGVHEIACLIDFGVDAPSVQESLPYVDELRRRFEADAVAQRGPIELPRTAVSTTPPTPASDLTPSAPQNTPTVAAPAMGAGNPFPLTGSQQQLYSLSTFSPAANAAYNEHMVLELDGPLNMPALDAALAQVVMRHEALRTVLVPTTGEESDQQRVLPTIDLELTLVDVSTLAAEAAETVSIHWRAEMGGRPLDLEHGPLARAGLLRLGPERHLLALVVHHTMADGLSLVVVGREWLALYDAFATGAEPPVLPAPMSIRDYAGWIEAALAQRDMEACDAWWRHQMAAPLPTFEPPTDRPRPSVRSFEGDRCWLHLDADFLQAVRNLGAKQGCTLTVTMLAAYAEVLRRWCGQDDVIVGIAAAHRPGGAQGEALVGHTTDVLPLRWKRDREADDIDFTEHMKATRRLLFDAQEHDCGFPHLLRLLDVKPEPARGSLVSTIFNIDPELPLPPSGGLQPRVGEPVFRKIKFDLALHVVPGLGDSTSGRGGNLTFGLDYVTDLFDATTTQRLLGHLRTLLAAAVEAPARPLKSLPLCTPAQRHQALYEWGGSRPFDANDANLGGDIAGQFRRQARQTPDAIAAVAGHRHLSYRQLDRRAQALAQQLRQLDIGPETPVALCTERSLERIVALLGILAAGGVYLPLDPADPARRLGYLLDDTGARLVLGTGEQLDRLPLDELDERGIEILELEELDHLDDEAEAPLPAADPDQLAYIVYTSGSTGQPKGVRVPHRAVLRLVQRTDFARMAPDETWLHAAPLAFDASTLEIWGALLHGSRLVLLPPGKQDLASIARVIQRGGVSSAWLTAALFQQMVEQQLPRLGGLRQLLAGGDVLAPDAVRRLLEAHEGLRLIDGYGPTENTTFTTCGPVDRPEDVGASVSIGRPIAGTRILVLDERGQPVPPGVPGELLAVGSGLARDYLAQPALTAERFVPNPYPSTPGERAYRTGDRARFLADGRLDFLGRIDQQVKVRGFRVEPGEIEAALGEHPEVSQAAVVLRRDEEDQSLVAFVSPRELLTGDGSVSPEVSPELAQGLTATIRTYLEHRLPPYMVPSVFEVLPRLPVNVNGKLDRSALGRLAAGAQTASAAVKVAPRTPLETRLAEMWCEVLKRDEVGVTENFFDLGGHSLLATRLLYRVHQAYGVELPMLELFQNPTIEELAGRVEEVRGE